MSPGKGGAAGQHQLAFNLYPTNRVHVRVYIFAPELLAFIHVIAFLYSSTSFCQAGCVC